MRISKKHQMMALMSVTALAGVGALGVQNASADSLSLKQGITSGDFDLTTQVNGDMNFPVMFDRPSGVNAAALAGTIRGLGTDSDLYKSAVKAVPDLSDDSKMNSLLSDALDPSSANYASARKDIVGLINWYNSLGGTKITTQDGQTYTTDNLDKPINVLAVGFSNKNSVNQAATDALKEINSAKTVGDVEKALDNVQSGTSTAYNNAFSAYADKVYAPNADLSELSNYTEVKPVLDAYENMYADGAASIRKELLNNQSSSTEAGVTFFESAVLAGSVNNDDSGSSTSNKPNQKTEYHTKWVDTNGNNLASPTTSETGYDEQKTFDGYTFKSVTTDDNSHTRTYVYEPKNPKPTTPDDQHKPVTHWIDVDGNTLKQDEDGQHPDKEGDDVPGYTLVRITTADNGDVTNVYEKTPDTPTKEVVTHWIDTNGNKLKDDEKGSHPDKDGKDVPGYTLVKTTTDEDGNVTNVYEKTPTPSGSNETKKTHTSWIDENGNHLRDDEDGNHPDLDGNDIPGYTFIGTTTDENGNTINHYKKNDEQKPHTYWVDTEGKTLKDPEDGQHPDNDGKSDIPGYKLVKTYTITDDDVKQGGKFAGTSYKPGDVINVYEKDVHTNWIDEQGHELKPQEDGAHPDNDGVSDIPGYILVSTNTDKDGNITNTYRKAPVTHWVDENGNKLKEDEQGQFPDNDGKSDIPGYELVSTKTDDDGNVTNTYKKIVHTAWVDENGKELKPEEDGAHPDNDGVSDIPGYTLVATKTDKDGNVINIYKKNPDKKAPKNDDSTPSEPATSEPASSGSTASEPASSGGGSQSLPQTGDNNVELSAAGVALLAALGLPIVGMKAKKREEE